jgi:choline dehydrogenase-like flavoprotein
MRPGRILTLTHSILEKYGIPPLIHLPSVGENLQDQLNTSIVFTTKTNITGTRSVAFVSAIDLFGSETKSVANDLLAEIPSYAETIARNSNGALTTESLTSLFKSQHDLIFNHNIPIGEYVFILDNPSQVHVGYWGLLPFSRGSVHVSSSNPGARPVLDPKFGLLDWDVKVQIAMSRFLREVIGSEETGGIFDEEVVPGLNRVPEGAGLEIWKDWIGEQCEFYTTLPSLLSPELD